MKGINIAECTHVVNILPPHDSNTTATPEVFSMASAAHASIILQLGVTGAAVTVTVEACDNFTPSNTSAIGFSYYAETTAAGDTFGDRTTVANTGFATSTNDTIMYCIEIDAAELPAGYPNLRVVFSDPGATTLANAVAILSGLRHGAGPTAIA